MDEKDKLKNKFELYVKNTEIMYYLFKLQWVQPYFLGNSIAIFTIKSS